MDCPLSADNAFGPAVHGCRGGNNRFDFTLTFEQSLLQIAPCALLLLLVPIRAKQLIRQNVKTLPTWAQTAKQAAIALLAASQLALLVIWSVTPVYRTKASVPAAAVSFLASLALFILSSMEHSRSIRPSSLINTWILFSLLFDLPQARTLWLRSGPRSLAAVFTTGIIAKAVVLCLEARSKRRSFLPAYRGYAPESIVSLYNRTLLWWLNGLFLKGYKSIIGIDKLYHISASLSSETVEATFQREWCKRRHQGGKRPLFWALASSFKGSLVGLVVPRLCLSAFSLSQPLLINRVTMLLSHPETEHSREVGRALIGAAVLIYLGLAICRAIFKRQLHRLLTQIRGAVVTAVHSQALTLPSDKLDDAAALTLITADVQRLTFSLQHIDNIFATPFEVAAATFLLQRQIGVSCIAPIALSLVISGISFWNSNIAVPMQKAWLSAVSSRVAYTASVLAAPKGFKMLGLTEYFTERIQNLRIAELVCYADYRKYVTWRNVFSGVPETMAGPVTLMMFTLINGGSALTTTVAFTTLSIVAILSEPVQNLIFAIPNFQTALASMDRIQLFLLLEGTSSNAGGVDDETSSAFSADPHAIELESRARLSPADEGLQRWIRISNGAVKLGKDDTSVLRDINLYLEAGSINLIIGSVGCGKSTMLKAIVGDLSMTEGHRDVAEDTSFAYCAQEAWLPNETVRQLIMATSEFDPQWYATVTSACALSSEVAAFPQADDTLIGNKGVSLSGGQRQRLALARALYSRASVLVADDVLSGLDANTAQSVFDRVFGPEGLCKTHGMTVVLATHAVKHLRSADHVVALSADGSIREQGPFDALDALKGYVHELSIKGTQASSAGEDEALEVAKPANGGDKLAAAEQDLARQTGDMRVYGHYARSLGMLLGSIVVGTALAVGFLMVFPSVWVRWWSEAEERGDHSRPLGLWIGAHLIFGLSTLLMLGANIWVMLIYTVPKSSAQLHKQLLLAVMRAPYSFFVNTDSGITLNRFSSDMALIEGEMAGSVMQSLSAASQCLGSAALIAAGARYVGAAIPFLLLVLYALQKFYLRTSRQLRFMELESQAPLLTHCSETLSGVTTIRAFGWQRSNHRKCVELLDTSQRPFYLMFCIQRWLGLVLDLTTAAIAVIVVAMAMTLRQTASAGSVGVSLLTILTFNTQLSWLIVAWTTLETSLGAVARCMNFEKSTASEDLPMENATPPAEWPQAGHLKLTDVGASYSDDGENVLKGISLSIQAGEKVGICGRSGSGKSSLLLTLLRLLDNNSGTITLDDVDLATVPRQTIRERVTALPQEAITVPGTLRDNIDPMTSSTAEAINAALEKVGLLDLVDQRGGLETEMKELGLSQGQMQLFAVARALLRKSKLLVVDEMTSSVDAVTEEKMVSVIKEEFAESTVLAVAHRLSTIRDFDKVVVMDKGRIVEIGSPSDLLAKEGGYFRTMWERSGH